jgi:hypothetical protein
MTDQLSVLRREVDEMSATVPQDIAALRAQFESMFEELRRIRANLRR